MPPAPRKNEFLSPLKSRKIKPALKKGGIKTEVIHGKISRAVTHDDEEESDSDSGSGSENEQLPHSLKEDESAANALSADHGDKENKSTVLKPTKAKNEISTVGDFRLPSETSVNQLFQRKELKLLTTLFNDVSKNKTEKMFQQYKVLTENKLKASDLLIQKLANDNNSLRAQLRQALKENHNMSSTNNSIHNHSSNNSHGIRNGDKNINSKELDRLTQEKDDLTSEVSDLQKTLEGLNHKYQKQFTELDLEITKSQIIKKLTNLECLEVRKTDDQRIAFKLKQTGDGCALFFELQLIQTSKDTVYYVPDIDNESATEDSDIEDFEENAQILRVKLDDYLLTPLELKIDVIGPLYFKLIKALGVPKAVL